MPRQAYRVSESTFQAIGSASRAGNVTMNETVDWREGMRDLGRQLRRVREFLGLSQDQVARLAGVSQGAVSRLEAGRGLATPMMVVLKVHRVLTRALHAFDPAIPDDEVRATLGLESPITPPTAGQPADDRAALRVAVAAVDDGIGLDRAAARGLLHHGRVRERVDPLLERRAAHALPTLRRRRPRVDRERVLGQMPAERVREREALRLGAEPLRERRDRMRRVV